MYVFCSNCFVLILTLINKIAKLQIEKINMNYNFQMISLKVNDKHFKSILLFKKLLKPEFENCV